ncbi:MAG: T9SS type A sorting domain-containing protein [Flavobacteriales bacterium]
MNTPVLAIWASLALIFASIAGKSASVMPMAPPPACSFNLIDNFTDGNFTASPAWVGETTQWQMVTNSDVPGNTSNARTIQVNPGNNAGGSYYVSTAISDWQTQQEWAFWMGRRFALSATSNVEIWLYANESNLESTTVDGYRLMIGDGTSNHEIRLQHIVNGAVASTVITSNQAINQSRSDFGLAFRVTRTQAGAWELFISSMPISNGTGAAPSADPTTLATISVGTGTNNSLVPLGTNYFGFKINMPSGLSASNRRTTEFDQIYFKPCLPNTTVQFASTSAIANETDGNITIPISITNPHPTLATTVQVALTSGNAAGINNYSTQTVTFPAASVSNQNVTINITNNESCEVETNYGFTLQNASGGYVAILGTQTTSALTLNDDEYQFMELVNTGFESGSISNWFTTPGDAFTASNSAPISGTYSIRHQDTGQTATGACSSSLAYDGAGLAGSETIWRFNLNHFGVEPNTSDYFIICLTNNDPNIAFQEINGYAIGVRPSPAYNQDYVTLWRTEGDILYSILTTTLDWGTAQTKVGFQVTRTADGTWSVDLDLDGDFNNLVNYGSTTDTYWDHLGYFGPFFVYNTSTKGKLSMDDISITQESCRSTYYSQGTAHSDDAIWATTPVGAPGTVIGGPFTNLVVQNGHTITMTNSMTCQNLEIEAGATLMGGSVRTTIKGDLLVNGTFDGESSTILLKGTESQTISGSGTATFFNLESENSAGISTTMPISLKGQLRPNAGTFNTNNQLTLISTLQGTGSIGTIQSGADVIGQITMQRFIPTAPQHWVYINNPMINQTVQDWNDDMITSGFPGSDYPSYNFNNIYWYNESTAGSKNMGWTGATNITDAIDPMKGFIVYMNANAVTLDMTGDFQKGTVNVPLTYNDIEPGNGVYNPDGWNLVGNIYPCAIDWEAVQAASTTWTGSNSTYYVYNAAEANYRAYNASSHAGTSNRYIASNQSFFVQAQGTGQSLTFTESVKATSSADFQRNQEDAMLVRMNLTKGTMTDEVLFAIVDEATLGFDDQYDAIKWDSPVATAPELAIVINDTTKASINAIPSFEENIEFPLWVEMPSAGDYTFSISEVLNLPSGVCLTVQDTLTGEVIPMAQGETITLNTTAAYSGNRLIIRLNAPLNVSTLPTSCNGGNDGSIQFESGVNGWMITATDNMENVYYANDGVIQNLPAGDYLVTYENSEALCTATTLGVTVSQPEIISGAVETTTDYCNSGASGRIEMIVENTDHFDYTIVNSNNEIVFAGSANDVYHMISGISADEYTVNMQSACYSQSFTVNLVDNNAVDLEISLNTPSLQLELGQTVTISANANSAQTVTYEWTVNGFDGGDQNFLEFVVNNPGTYEIVCIADNGSCSDIATATAYVESTVNIEEELGNDPHAVITRMGNALMISFENASASKATISLYNSSGALVMRMSGNADQGQVRTIDMNSLATGVYTIDVQQDNKILARQQIFK